MSKKSKIILLILAFIICEICVIAICSSYNNSANEENVVTKQVEDTSRIEVIRNLYGLLKQLGKIETKDSLLQKALQEKHNAIDSLLETTLDFKEGKINLILITKKYNKVVIEKDFIVQKVDSIHKEYVKLYGENYDLKDKLANEKEYSSYLTNENQNLKTQVTKASDVKLSGIKLIGLAETGGLFSKTKIYETNKAAKIKQIKFSCILPKNELAKKEDKKIDIVILGVKATNTINIIKDTTVNYRCDEIIINLFLKAPLPNIENGKHKVIVRLNGKVQYNDMFIVE